MKYEIERSNFLISQIPMPMFEKKKTLLRPSRINFRNALLSYFCSNLKIRKIRKFAEKEDSNRDSRFDSFQTFLDSRSKIRG